jgi:hypothetical protein
MIALFKGFIPGCILTWIVSTAMGSNGSSGGFLNIFRTPVMGHEIYWSWPLMVAAVLLAWAMFYLTE